ncbi:hypothetical protein OIE66_38505 [Nonomuraea sp. NBC_01738]|uniref:hypothetical protein n=1 Tax=Nonomuraea sp. NBC_01738 TaxID=2976003 RepID=UPI002E125CE8|nr:hypothetical protein OIE66_38505 [Nonomuraea sp. NBC_01738]
MSWLAVAPAGAADQCGDQVVALKPPATVASVCEELTSLRANGTYTRMTAPKSSDTAMAVESMAKRLGLEGLAKTTAMLSFADLGGVAAAAGMPALPDGTPGKAGLPDVSRLTEAPDLPGLPRLPSTPALPGTSQLPVRVAKLDTMPDASGLTGAKTPLSLPKKKAGVGPLDGGVGDLSQVGTLKDGLAGALPDATKKLDEVTSTVPVPGSEKATKPVKDLLSGVQLK